MTPAMPTGKVQAQWAVYDGAAWSQRLGEYVKEAERWFETVEHYTTIVNKSIQQVMTLGGILDLTDKLVANNKNIVATFANLSRSVRGIFALKRQIEALVHYQIQAIRNMDDRLRNGIFDLAADKRDLENYLKESLGRASMERVATLEQIANMDTLLSRWQDDLMLARGKKAALVKQKQVAEENLRIEEEKTGDDRCGVCISDLKAEIASCETQINQLDAVISELMDKIEARLKQYNLEMEWRGQQAHDVMEMEKAWDGFFSVKEDLLRQVDEYSYGDEHLPVSH